MTHSSNRANKTDAGFFTFMFMVLVACVFAWWTGWDKVVLGYFQNAVATGDAVKQNVQQKIDTTKDMLQLNATQPTPQP